ncbi:MAG: hypothetical protein JRN66_05645 [Nitrososphaerota archaeon]|nr:hypothetical protein [Nitrososphaerota archaeon]
MSDAEKDVLLGIYIGQNIREQGVLQSATKEEEITRSLLSHNLIAENRWYRLDLLRTTGAGDKFAQKILEHRIAETRENIKKKFQELPPRVLAFIIKRFALYDTSFPKERPSKPTAFDYWSPDKRIWEKRILSDGWIWINWTKFFETLQSFGLSVIAYNYVSTRGGELRDSYYVIPREVNDLLSKMDVGNDLNDDEENKLQLYSFLLLSISPLDFTDIDEAKIGLNELMKTYSIDEGQLGRIIMEMSKDKITSEYRGFSSETRPYDILDKDRFYEYIETNIIKPAKNILLDLNAAIINYQPFEPANTKSETEPKLEPSEQDKLSHEIREFEQDLRELIKQKLGKGWDKRIENDLPAVMEEWKKREKGDKNWGKEPEKDLINYADFPDYIAIITKYSRYFSNNSEDLSDITVKLKDLMNYGRNPIAHGRTIIKDEIAVSKKAIKFLRQRLFRN